MTAPITHVTRYPLYLVQRARMVLIGLHVPFAVAGTFSALYDDQSPGVAPFAILGSIAVAGLQLRHSLAASRNDRPAYWPWTILALMMIVYAPMGMVGWSWAGLQSVVSASTLMLLRGPLAWLVAIVPPLVTPIVAYQAVLANGGTYAQAVAEVWLWPTSLIVVTASLYGATRLVSLLNELYATRTELAEVAIERERSRVSRDLHDLLGYSLSAVSLKGDLALRLQDSDSAAARAEIASLAAIARDALHDIRSVARDQRAVSLQGEIDAAAGLLAAAGIATHLDVQVETVQPPAREVLGWAVREGVTNLLRHSIAQRCSISVGCEGTAVRLEITNDGATPNEAATSHGSGLMGLAERARAVSGSVEAAPTGDGEFRLMVIVPIARSSSSEEGSR